MKKIIIVILFSMLMVGTSADSTPRFKIIANSNNKEDIKEIYKIKTKILDDYKEWSKGVDNPSTVLYDHLDEYQATYQNLLYTVILGEGKGKIIEGEIKVNYCEQVEDVKVKSFLFDWLFK